MRQLAACWAASENKMRLIKSGMPRREIPLIEWYIFTFFLILTREVMGSITFTHDLRPFRERVCVSKSVCM